MLETLNEQQVKAVLKVDGPVMVFAGAGTGKTRTLTHRIAYMINEKKINPSNILAITFTNKATNEMKTRLRDLIGLESYNVTISTFHALCARILRADIISLGYQRTFEIIDDEDQLKVVKEVLENNNFDKKKFTPKHIRSVINNCKCFNVKSEYETENRIWSLYEKHMKDNNLLDFDDLLIKTYELFTKFPDVLSKYKKRFRYILVDEFQDTNKIQYDLLHMLTNESRNLFVVGDDDQSIYSFRGTNYENMTLILQDYPELEKFFLTQNYRSTQKILDGSNNLIKKNNNREPKELFSEHKGSSDDVEVYQAIDENDEADYVINNILKLHHQGNPLSSFAILYRNNVLGRNFELGLIRTKTPYKIFGGMSYLKRREIKDILAYLKLIVNNDDLFSFQRIVNVPTRGLGPSTINKLISLKKERKLSLFDSIDAMNSYVPNSKYQALISFKKMISDLSLKLENSNYTLIQLFEDLMELTAYKKIFDDDEDKEDRLENIEEFKSILYKIENNGEIASIKDKLLGAFDEAILSDDKLQSQKESVEGVTLSTIHSAKGLEFDYVFVIGLEEGLFPNIYRTQSEFELEEERRIAYVAVTRAKKKLFLTSSTKRMVYGITQRNNQSRFLIEFLNVPKIQVPNQEKKPKKIIFNNETTFKVGDKIIHDVYGEGIIIMIDKEIGQICFTQKGQIKKFMLNHPSIKKVIE